MLAFVQVPQHRLAILHTPTPTATLASTRYYTQQC